MVNNGISPQPVNVRAALGSAVTSGSGEFAGATGVFALTQLEAARTYNFTLSFVALPYLSTQLPQTNVL